MQQYTGEEFLPGFGSSGSLDPGDIAQEIYGDKFDYGHACAYLLRRFGFHFEGYDDYKTLASWVLTTPMEGVYLWAMIKGYSHANCSFGVRFSKKVYKKLNRLESMERLVMFADAQRLAMENGYPFAMTFFKRKFNRRDMQAIRVWEKQQGILDKKYEDFPKEEMDALREKLFDEMGKRRIRACNDLEKCGWINPAAKSLENFCSEINAALRHSFEELLKPVHVRDCYINILGDCNLPCCECKHSEDGDDDCLRDKCDKFAQPHKYAGMGVLNFVEAFNSDNKKQGEK